MFFHRIRLWTNPRCVKTPESDVDARRAAISDCGIVQKPYNHTELVTSRTKRASRATPSNGSRNSSPNQGPTSHPTMIPVGTASNAQPNPNGSAKWNPAKPKINGPNNLNSSILNHECSRGFEHPATDLSCLTDALTQQIKIFLVHCSKCCSTSSLSIWRWRGLKFDS